MRIGLHWSVAVTAALLTLLPARGLYPYAHPGYPTWVYWALGLATATGLLASLLAHELAHAVVARRHAIEVRGITLWMLGGVAQLRTEPRDPRTELRIAGAGPAISAVLGVLFTGVAAGMNALGAPDLAVTAVSWPAGINVVLAVFNALPAAPLDGGRVLRAFLWRRTGDRLRATLGATAAGRFVGWFLVLTGFVSVLAGGSAAGLWPALVGWFIIAAATAEACQERLRDQLAGTTVGEVMTLWPVTAPSGSTVAQFLADAPLGRLRHSAFPVLAPDGSAVGLVSVTRINRMPLKARSTTPVDAVMRPLGNLETAEPEDSAADLLPRLSSSAERRALVLHAGRLVGIVSLSDIGRAAQRPANLRHRGRPA
uniref:site-2 protease family protein n=1 Tax=Streptomyces polyasparticus TaxID=2767826 RepID=UPI00280B6CDF|nr:site-2 protease family protein [Streptomyces polyasparticus]